MKFFQDLLWERLKAIQEPSKVDIKLITNDISRLPKLFEMTLKENKP
jgi:hypothetical protein